MSNIRKKTVQGLKVGDNFTVVRAFSETDMLSFSEIARDYNPVHFDKRFSTIKNFNDRICHGREPRLEREWARFPPSRDR